MGQLICLAPGSHRSLNRGPGGNTIGHQVGEQNLDNGFGVEVTRQETVAVIDQRENGTDQQGNLEAAPDDITAASQRDTFLERPMLPPIPPSTPARPTPGSRPPPARASGKPTRVAESPRLRGKIEASCDGDVATQRIVPIDRCRATL